MGLDVSSGLYYGILVGRDEILQSGPEVKQCLRDRHRYDIASDFRYCPQCSSEIVVVPTLVPRPELLAIWSDLTDDLMNWRGEGNSSWDKPGAVSFYNAAQTRGSDSFREVPKVLLLGVGLKVSASHRSGNASDVCAVNEFELEVWRPRIREVANKAKWGGRPLELVVCTYLSY